MLAFDPVDYSIIHLSPGPKNTTHFLLPTAPGPTPEAHVQEGLRVGTGTRRTRLLESVSRHTVTVISFQVTVPVAVSAAYRLNAQDMEQRRHQGRHGVRQRARRKLVTGRSRGATGNSIWWSEGNRGTRRMRQNRVQRLRGVKQTRRQARRRKGMLDKMRDRIEAHAVNGKKTTEGDWSRERMGLSEQRAGRVRFGNGNGSLE